MTNVKQIRNEITAQAQREAIEATRKSKKRKAFDRKNKRRRRK